MQNQIVSKRNYKERSNNDKAKVKQQLISPVPLKLLRQQMPQQNSLFPKPEDDSMLKGSHEFGNNMAGTECNEFVKTLCFVAETCNPSIRTS